MGALVAQKLAVSSVTWWDQCQGLWYHVSQNKAAELSETDS